VVLLPESLTAELRPAAPIVLAATPTGVGKTHEALRALARQGRRRSGSLDDPGHGLPPECRRR